MTASIYTVPMLRAYLQGKLDVLDRQISPTVYDDVVSLNAMMAVYSEVIALCEGIEEHECSGKSIHHHIRYNSPNDTQKASVDGFLKDITNNPEYNWLLNILNDDQRNAYYDFIKDNSK